jgi:hypothetical protein
VEKKYVCGPIDHLKHSGNCMNHTLHHQKLRICPRTVFIRFVFSQIQFTPLTAWTWWSLYWFGLFAAWRVRHKDLNVLCMYTAELVWGSWLHFSTLHVMLCEMQHDRYWLDTRGKDWHSEDRASWSILIIKSQQDVLFLNFILVKNCTCFGQTYCPSSGVLIQYSQPLVFVILVMLTVC